ncbi:hypothetical protein [Trebonia sp.]|nr:hypothetical protein [Trebonia sp.]
MPETLETPEAAETAFYAVYRHMLYPEVNQTTATMNSVFGGGPPPSRT